MADITYKELTAEDRRALDASRAGDALIQARGDLRSLETQHYQALQRNDTDLVKTLEPQVIDAQKRVDEASARVAELRGDEA